MSFSDELKEFALDAMDQTEEVARGAVLSLWRAVIYDTPVDTGRAKGNWFPSWKGSNRVNNKAKDKTGARATARAEKSVISQVHWDVFTLTNNLPYIQKLEEGHSTQAAPHSMVRLNVAKFQSIVNKQAKKANK